jgi:hypothetical protein
MGARWIKAVLKIVEDGQKSPKTTAPAVAAPVMVVDRESMATTAAPTKQTEEMA